MAKIKLFLFDALMFIIVYTSARSRYSNHPSEDDGYVQEKAAAGCIGLTGFIGAALIGLLVFTCTGCAWMNPSAAYEPVITKDSGVVVSLRENWVEVSYDAVNRKNDTVVRNIYYKPCGHSYELADQYPDHTKERRPCDER